MFFFKFTEILLLTACIATWCSQQSFVKENCVQKLSLSCATEFLVVLSTHTRKTMINGTSALMHSESKWVFQNYANCLFVPSTVLQMEPDADDPLAGNLLGADADGYLHCNSVLRIVLATRATKLERFHFILLGAYWRPAWVSCEVSYYVLLTVLGYIWL